MVTIHHLEYSRSTRILWLLEELGVEYELKTYKRHPKTMRAPPEMKELHPLGRSPIVAVDGHTLAESGAIIEYFCEREGKLRPTEGQALLDYRYWLHYAEGSAMSPLLLRLVMNKLRSGPVPFFLKPITRGIADKIDAGFVTGELTAHFGWVEQALSGREFFAGTELSGADIQMFYPVTASIQRAGLPERPNTLGWLERMNARPALQAALEKGGATIPEGL